MELYCICFLTTLACSLKIFTPVETQFMLLWNIENQEIKSATNLLG